MSKNNQNFKIYIKSNKLTTDTTNKQPHNIYELFKRYNNDDKRDYELDWGKAKGHEFKW